MSCDACGPCCITKNGCCTCAARSWTQLLEDPSSQHCHALSLALSQAISHTLSCTLSQTPCFMHFLMHSLMHLCVPSQSYTLLCAMSCTLSFALTLSCRAVSTFMHCHASVHFNTFMCIVVYCHAFFPALYNILSCILPCTLKCTVMLIFRRSPMYRHAMSQTSLHTTIRFHALTHVVCYVLSCTPAFCKHSRPTLLAMA